LKKPGNARKTRCRHRLAEHRARKHQQQSAVVERLQPPNDERPEPRVVRKYQGHALRDREGRQQGDQQGDIDRLPMRLQQAQAEIHGFVGQARAQGERQGINAHAAACP
jgi:hypothetical protein